MTTNVKPTRTKDFHLVKMKGDKSDYINVDTVQELRNSIVEGIDTHGMKYMPPLGIFFVYGGYWRVYRNESYVDIVSDDDAPRCIWNHPLKYYAMEDNSVAYCLLPRTPEDFWDRMIKRYDSGTKIHIKENHKPQKLFTIDSTVSVNGKVYGPASMINISFPNDLKFEVLEGGRVCHMRYRTHYQNVIDRFYEQEYDDSLNPEEHDLREIFGKSQEFSLVNE